MGQVNVHIAGRTYALGCRDGDEGHITALAEGLGQRADDLTRQLGQMSEARLLLMTALMVADQLHDSRSGKETPAAAPDPAISARLNALVSRAEALATRLDA